jgi:signal transduction histidine kinase
MVISALAVIAIAIASMSVVFGVVQKKENELLQKDLAVASSRLSLELNNMLDEFAALARNPSLVNGLSDSAQTAVYLRPLLSNFQFRQIGAVALQVRDYRGRPILSSQASLFESIDTNKITRLMTAKRFAAHFVLLEDQWHLLLIHSIEFPDSNDSQGFLVSVLAIDQFFAQWLAPDRDPRTWGLQFTQENQIGFTGRLMTNHDLPINLTSALLVKEPLEDLRLQLHLTEEKRGAAEALQSLLPIFGLFVFIALLSAWLASRRLGKHLAKPIIALAERARLVKQTQEFSEPLPVLSVDEVGTLTQDFNAMLEQLQQLQEQLKRTANLRGARLATIFELSPDGFIEIDAAGNIGYLNPAFTTLTGIALTHLARNDWQSLAFQLNAQLAENEERLESLGQADSQSGAVERLVRLHTPSLKTLGVAKRVAEEGVIVLYWRDLSREAEMNTMKNAFLAKAAHELRTPLTSILGFTELLAKDANATAKQAEIVAIMARQGKNLLQLIHDLLDLARLEVQNPQWQRQSPQSLVALTRLIASDFQLAGDERQWIFALEEHLPEVRLDPNTYRQVLSNLLSNAMKYSPKGSPIRIASRVEERNGVVWQGIAIEDRGIGMNAEELERLGQHFYRANPKGEIAGTGLGLAVVEEIMGLHGGRVEYASVLGVGSTITVWFLQTGSFGKV